MIDPLPGAKWHAIDVGLLLFELGAHHLLVEVVPQRGVVLVSVELGAFNIYVRQDCVVQVAVLRGRHESGVVLGVGLEDLLPRESGQGIGQLVQFSGDLLDVKTEIAE